MSAKRKIFLFHSVFFLILFLGFLLPKFYYYFILFFNLSYFFLVYKLKKLFIQRKNIVYFILPILFLNSLYLYLGLLIYSFWINLFLFLGINISYYYFKELRRLLKRGAGSNLGNFSIWTDVLGLLSVFFISSFTYALGHFIPFNDLILMLLLIFYLFFYFCQNILNINISNPRIVLFTLIFLFSIIPIIWSIFLLPFGYNILGLILSICYYSALSFMKFYLQNSLTNKKIKYNLIFIISIFIVIFLTINWK